MDYTERDMVKGLVRQALEEWRLMNLIRFFEASVGTLNWNELEPVLAQIKTQLGLPTMPNADDLR